MELHSTLTHTLTLPLALHLTLERVELHSTLTHTLTLPLARHLTLERVEQQRLLGRRRYAAVGDGPRKGHRAMVLLARIRLALWNLRRGGGLGIALRDLRWVAG